MGSPTNPATENAHGPWHHRITQAIEVAGWLSLVAALTGWAMLRAGDLWTPSAILMFGPRWVLALPPALLLTVAAVLRRRGLLPVVSALGIVVGPVAGLCIPWDRLGSEPPAGPRLRILTCNMHYAKVDPGPLDRLVAESRPDVVVLQEWRDCAQSRLLLAPGWHTHREPGLFLASRHPIRRADRLGYDSSSERGSVMRCSHAPFGAVTVFNLHFATPRKGSGTLVGFDRRGLDEIRANGEMRWRQSEFVATEAARVAGPVLVAGDFNTPPESAIFRQVWSGYVNAFSDTGWGWGYTFRSRQTVVRIDHVLVGGGGCATKCWVGPDVGSPHRPVLAVVNWPLGSTP